MKKWIFVCLRFLKRYTLAIAATAVLCFVLMVVLILLLGALFII